MTEFSLPEFSINFSSANGDILKLMKIIKPLWKESDVEIKSMSGGYSCSMYKVSSKILSKDAVTIRVRKLLAEVTLPGINRVFERKIIQLMSKLRLFPKIHSVFKNGYCYQYVEGQPCFNITTDFTEARKSFDYENFPFQIIAKRLAKIHSVKVDDEDYSKCSFFSNLLDIMDNHYSDTPHPLLVDKPTLRKEIVQLTEYSKNFNLKIGLCHGDPHPGNMVWNKEKNEVTFMDWELTSIGYQGFDVAYFLTSITEPVFLRLSGYSNIDDDVADEIKKKFIRLYLVEHSQLNNFELIDEHVAELERHVKFFTLVWYLTMATYMGPMLSEVEKSPQMEKLSELGVKHFERYLLSKDKIFEDLKLT